MAKVTGIGGIFFKCKNREATLAWYKEHLGIEGEDFGLVFPWRTTHGDASTGYTVWSPFSEDTDYFEPSDTPLVVNFRVDGIEELAASLTAKGVTVLGEIAEEPNGKFVSFLDLDGRKVELWEPAPPDKDPYLPK